MKTLIRNLIVSLDHENGVPEQTYFAILDLVTEVMGEESAKEFNSYTDAVDGFFYFMDTKTAIAAWDLMEAVSK